jgi:type VI secretion system secreted protein VgrG
MATYTQQNRLLSLTTPLGTDVLLLQAFTGEEALSRPFVYHLDLASHRDDIAAKDIVGQAVTWSVEHFDKAPRYFNGVVSRFFAGGPARAGMRLYRAEVVPWLWFLSRSADCRIFQNKSVPDIVKAVFDGLGFTDYQFKLQGTYDPREYCVQYRETAFNFVSRLLEHEGIFYFFHHEDGKHTLVLADDAGAYADCPESQVDFSEDALAPNHAFRWEHRYEFRPGKWTETDYNFETPATDLQVNTNTLVDQPGADKFELRDYPGDYLKSSGGTRLVKLRMQEEEAPYHVVSGASTCCTFTPAGKFTLASHEIASEAGQAYVVTSVQHAATDTSYGGSAAGSGYQNSFTCIPAAVTFRPPRLAPRPVVQGPQTAVVTGPKGEEIYVDKYGRVKVQFYWDRLGKKDENTTCWIRVSQNWAGKNWGMVFHPRIGQEVVVDFLEGDPDRPLVTGRVYNADQMPPYALPDNMTQSVLKTRSSKQGSAENFNELRFEDKKGSEEVYFHAEKDFNRVVENNDTLKVGFDKKDKGDQTVEVFNNQTIKVGTPQSPDGSQTTTVHKDRTVTLEMGNDTLTIKMGNQTTKLDLGKSETEAMQSIELKVGESSVKLDQTGVTIKGMLISIQGQLQTQVKGTITQVNGDAMLQMQGGITMIN